METIGDRVKIIRGKRTLSDFGNEIGFTKSHLSSFERNVVKPTTVFYTALSKIGININWLLTGKGNMYACITKKNTEIIKDNVELRRENTRLRERAAVEIIEIVREKVLKKGYSGSEDRRTTRKK